MSVEPWGSQSACHEGRQLYAGHSPRPTGSRQGNATLSQDSRLDPHDAIGHKTVPTMRPIQVK